MKLRELLCWLLLAGTCMTGACSTVRQIAADQAVKVVDEIVVPKVVSLLEKKLEPYVTKKKLDEWKAAADADKSGDVSGAEWATWLAKNWQEVILSLGSVWLIKRNIASAEFKTQLAKDVESLKKSNGPAAG